MQHGRNMYKRVRQLVKAVIPSIVRSRLMSMTPTFAIRMMLYILRFGVKDGLAMYHKIARAENGLIRIGIPRISTPVVLRANSSDIRSFGEIFVEEIYDLPVKLNFRPKLIVDGGANAGYASVYFANKYSGARVVAIEPEETNFEILRANTSSYSNIKIAQAAIWNRRAFMKIENPQDSKWTFRVVESECEENGIPAVTVDEIMQSCNANRIDILKLDIEGAEKEVFSQGAAWMDKVNILIIELHDRFKPGCREAFYSAIAGRNFTEFRKGVNVFLIHNALLSS